MKKIILWVGVVIIVLMCFFPPWTEDETTHRATQGAYWRDTINLGYHCILRPPRGGEEIKPLHYNDTDVQSFKDSIRQFNYEQAMEEGRNSYDVVKIDTTRLIIQCVIVCLITGALLFTLKDKKAEGGGK